MVGTQVGIGTYIPRPALALTQLAEWPLKLLPGLWPLLIPEPTGANPLGILRGRWTVS